MVATNPRHTYTKRGIYYFTRLVPKDMVHLYEKSRIVRCLRTKSPVQARKAASALSNKLDQYWAGIRLQELAHEFQDQFQLQLNSRSSDVHTLEEALEQYLSVKGLGKGELFFAHTRRSVGYVNRYCGSKCLDQYSSADAARLRESLRKQGLKSSSIQRNFSCIKAVFNFAILENGFDCKNAVNGHQK
jgi:hypothetical protein